MTDWFNNIISFDSLSFEWDRLSNPGEFYVNQLPPHNDSIGVPVIKEVYAQSPVEIAEITDQLKKITSYGIGFDDVVGLIAIPLIIALFAFSFPFIFNEVNRINDKYDSKNIADLLRSSAVYKIYFLINKISIVILFLYALSSLVFKDFTRITVLNYGNWILLVVAGFYSYVIFMFVQTCLTFNKPSKVVYFAENAFKTGEMRLRLKNKRLLLLHKLTGFGKKEITKERKLRKIELINYYAEYNNITLYINNLKDLGFYSLKSEDLPLFYSAITGGVDRIAKFEKESDSPHHYVFLLLKPIFEYYSRLKPSLEVEDSLIFTLFRFYNKSLLIDILDIVDSITCTVFLANGECQKAISQYISHSKYGFSFVLRFPQIAYVEGLKDNYLSHRQQMIENWDMICNFHFLAAAYWFAKGNYDIFDSMISGHSRREPLYPYLRWHILLRYIRCRNHINVESGGDQYDYFEAKRLFKEPLNLVKLIDRFAITFLLIAKDDDLMLINITDEDIERLREVKEKLKLYVNGIKNDRKLIKMYPHILTADFDRIYNDSLSVLKMIKNGECLSTDDSVRGKSWRSGWFKRTIGFKTDEPVKYRSIFDETIAPQDNLQIMEFLQKSKNSFREELTRFYNIGRSKSENMLEVDQLSIALPRSFFLHEEWHKNIYFIDKDIWNIIRCRIIYLTFNTLRKCKNENIVTSVEDFESCVSKVVKDQPENYVCIDCENPIRNLLLGERVKESLIKKLNWLRLNDMRYRLLEGLSDYEFYKGSIIIVHKQNMPSVIGWDEKLTVDISEMPSKNGKRYEMILSIDPHLKMISNSSINIVVIRLKKS